MIVYKTVQFIFIYQSTFMKPNTLYIRSLFPF